jgi:hypothetical protein
MKRRTRLVPASARLEGKGTTDADAKWRAGIETVTARYREKVEAEERWREAERSREEPTKSRRPRSGQKDPQRINYEKDDKPLVDEGEAGIERGIYINSTDAGAKLAKRAAGHGTEGSIAARLAKRIRARLNHD